MAPRIRRAVRALVLDPDDRTLLTLIRLPHVEFWATPGGGIGDDEADHDALRRELHEEVGYTDVAIGPPIWIRSHRFPIGGYDGQSETIFLVRVDGEPGPSLLSEEQLRAELLVDRAWWTPEQLLASPVEFAPRQLPQLVSDLLAHGPPATPIEVGI